MDANVLMWCFACVLVCVFASQRSIWYRYRYGVSANVEAVIVSYEFIESAHRLYGRQRHTTTANKKNNCHEQPKKKKKKRMCGHE